MMKRLIALFLTGIVVVSMIGCGKSEPSAVLLDSTGKYRIESGGDNVGVALVFDRETGIRYILNVRSGEMKMLTDSSGSPSVVRHWAGNNE